MNLLVEIGFNNLAYRQIHKASDLGVSMLKEELRRHEISYRKLEVFFSKYRLTFWLRLGQGEQGEARLRDAVAAFLNRLANMTEVCKAANSLIALVGGTVLSLQVGGLVSGTTIKIGGKPFEVKDTQHYWRELGKNMVVLDNGQREKLIRRLLVKAATEAGGEVVSSPVMNEVVVSAEQPVLQILTFNQELTAVPEKLIMIVMEKHLCFGIKENEKLLNKAAYISNHDGESPDLNGALVKAASLYYSDLDVALEERQRRLKSLPYLKGLGNYYDKQQRLEKIVLAIADQVDAGENVCNMGRQASALAKIDLTAKICALYPEFSGQMGGIIAQRHGASDMVASAIIEHWCPGKYSRRLPHTLVGALLGVADRLDDICGHYHQGEFKLSQHRMVKTWFDEMIAIIDSVALDVAMSRLLKFSLSLYESQHLVPWREKDLDYLLKVFTGRLFCYLRTQDYPEDIANALTLIQSDNVYASLEKARIMAKSGFAEETESCAEACKALDRICAQEYKYEEAAREFLEQPEEKDLFEVYLVSRDEIRAGLADRRFSDVLVRLAKLKAPLMRFLNAVDLDTDNQPLKFNRLSLLAEIRQLYHQYADFSLL